MDLTDISGVLQEAVSVVLRIIAPIMLLSMGVGVFMAIIQAVTQIHEQSLSFVMKLIVVISLLILGGGWMLRSLQEFALNLYALM